MASRWSTPSSPSHADSSTSPAPVPHEEDDSSYDFASTGSSPQQQQQQQQQSPGYSEFQHVAAGPGESPVLVAREGQGGMSMTGGYEEGVHDGVGLGLDLAASPSAGAATTTQPFTSPFQTPAPASSYTFPPIPAVAEPCSAETEAPSARSPSTTSTTPYYSRWADPDYVPFPPTNPMRLLKSPPSPLGAPPPPSRSSAAIPIRHPETLNQQALSGTFRSSSSKASGSASGGVLAVAALAATASPVGRELHAPTPPPPPSPASPVGSSETEGEVQGQCARCAALGQRSEEVEQQLEEAVQRIVSVEDERNELRERLEEVRRMFGNVEKAREEVLLGREGEGEAGGLGAELGAGREDKWGAHGMGSGLEEEVMMEGTSFDAGWRIETEAAVKMRAEVEEHNREREALIARVMSLDRRIPGGGGRVYSRDELFKLRFVANVQPDLRNAPREMVDPNFRRKSPPHPAIPRYGPELPPQAVAYRRPSDEMQRAVQKERELFKESWDEEMEKPGSWEEDEGTLYKRVLDRVAEGMRLWREEQSGEEEEEEPTASSPSSSPASATSPPRSTALDYWPADASESALCPDVERATAPSSPAQLSSSPPPPLAATSAFLSPSRRGSCDLPSLGMVFDDGWGELGDAPVYSGNGDARFGGGGRRGSASRRRSLSSGGESVNSGSSVEGSYVGHDPSTVHSHSKRSTPKPVVLSTATLARAPPSASSTSLGARRDGPSAPASPRSACAAYPSASSTSSGHGHAAARGSASDLEQKRGDEKEDDKEL